MAGVTAAYVAVEWPWNEADPESMASWDGTRAFPRAADDPEWSVEPFRVSPDPSLLKPGDLCSLHIPPTTAYVIDVANYEEPLDVGWLPRPNTLISLMKQGHTVNTEAEEVGFTIDPAGSEPIEISLLFRPYRFLVDGDEVADADGHAWRFAAPWNWTPFGRSVSGSPKWPLVLLGRREREADPDEAELVARATSVGSHSSELRQWSMLCEFDVPPALPPAQFQEE